MKLWGLLTYVPGLPPHRTYRGCLELCEDTRAFLERIGAEAPDLPPLPRTAEACAFYADTMTALIEAVHGVSRGLDLDDATALFNERAPLR